jgi:murein endopeptidase
MRAFVGFVGLVVTGLVGISSAADARAKDADAKDAHDGRDRHARDHKDASKDAKRTRRPTQHDDHPSKKRAARLRTLRERDHIEPRLVGHGQSVGLPWAGRLQHATALPPGDGYLLRRPERAFGTQTTIELTQQAIAETLDAFPDEHVLAIGDISAPSGGTITQHRSHQSGRDIDVGLFYLERPAGYPASFVHADEDNLDCAATFKLLEAFLATADDDGGVQMVFLDFEVQGILYRWALEQGISERRLARIFQYPHGRGSFEGIVRHEPNHDNHMHVRFKCPPDDTACH